MAASPPLVAVFGVLVATLGGVLVLVGLGDAFLTILHPDRDGRISATVNRAIWRVAVAVARLRPSRRQEILGFAGPSMVVADILVWMLLPIVGYGFLVWPFLGGGFEAPAAVGSDLWDALYFSGVTFTTLGYGDITPVSRLWEMLSVLEAITGFLVMSTSIAYVVAVFEGVDQRDALALQIYSETGGTWNGGDFVRRVLADEDEEALRHRVESWSLVVRELHGRLYRFHGLALYLRTHGLDLGPERMLYALSDVSLRCRVLAASPDMRRLRPAAEHLSVGMEHFAHSIVRRHGRRAARRAFEEAAPTEGDRRLVREAWALAAERLGANGALREEDERHLLVHATRLRIFLGELDRLTRWRVLLPEAERP